jgi:protein-S-isoprenylcysteine O-methyltransferase Ste14
VQPVLNTLLFTVFVPGTVAGLIPWLLRAGRVAHPTRFDLALGAMATVFGLAIYLHTAFWGFALHGRGTPAPIAPTKRLVIEGLHRHVRNPMYLGVLLIILGQAILFRSVATAVYAAAFWLVAHVFVLFYEEPTLSKQFGAEYDAYRAQVPRWFPRL